MDTRGLPPRGHYLAHEVGRLAGVSGRTVGQWARRGYIRSSQSGGRPRVYSSQDIAEAMVVHLLLEHHVAHRAIRDAVSYLREEGGTAWPLTHADLAIPPDHRRHVEDGIRKQTVVVGGTDATSRHPVLPDLNLERVAMDLRRGGWAVRDTRIRHIEVDPDRFSGRPVIAGLRVPAEDVARLADQPGGRKILRADYDVTNDQIRDAVEWWSAVTAYENAA